MDDITTKTIDVRPYKRIFPARAMGRSTTKEMTGSKRPVEEKKKRNGSEKKEGIPMYLIQK
jgi:hypothetical protein